MLSPHSLDEIRNQVEELASRIDAPQELLPTFGFSKRDGCPSIETNGQFFDYSVTERDQVIQRVTAFTKDELLYIIFQDITLEMANSYAKSHRNPRVDYRRVLFEHQLHLLSAVNKNWKEKRRNEINDILKRHPFVDHG